MKCIIGPLIVRTVQSADRCGAAAGVLYLDPHQVLADVGPSAVNAAAAGRYASACFSCSA
jgi:hypothetical protein